MENEKKGLKKRQPLGKGLGALLSDTPMPRMKEGDKHEMPEGPVLFSMIDVGAVEANQYQPRTTFEEEALDELAESIKVQGIIQPLTVRKLSEGKYQLISGERRLRASKIAGLEQVPAYIRTADDQQMLEMALIENIQREDLDPLEVALSYQRLITECSLRQEDLGNRVGKKRSTVTNYLRLLKLPDEVQAALRKRVISMGHARALINVEKIDQQLGLFQRTVQEDLSVRKVEELAKELNQPKSGPKKESKEPGNISPEMKRLQSGLASHLGTQVKIKADNLNRGEIKIPFQSVEDLNRILDIISFSL